jgi:hypothetical protein
LTSAAASAGQVLTCRGELSPTAERRTANFSTSILRT